MVSCVRWQLIVRLRLSGVRRISYRTGHEVNRRLLDLRWYALQIGRWKQNAPFLPYPELWWMRIFFWFDRTEKMQYNQVDSGKQSQMKYWVEFWWDKEVLRWGSDPEHHEEINDGIVISSLCLVCRFGGFSYQNRIENIEYSWDWSRDLCHGALWMCRGFFCFGGYGSIPVAPIICAGLWKP